MKQLNNKRRKESGQLLVEASVATGIIVILVISVVTLSLRALNQNRLVSDQVVAMNLAAEGYEIAKNILDGNAYYGGIPWNDGFNQGGFYEMDFTTLEMPFYNFPRSLSGAPKAVKINANNFDDAFINAQKIHLTDSGYLYDEAGTEMLFKRVIQIEAIGNQQINLISSVRWLTPKNPDGETVSVSGSLLGWR
jgi:hypothetical protein